MKRHTHSHTHGERILIDEIAYASALRQVSPMWKIFVSLYSLFLCLSSHTWVISVLILCAMLIAMTAIGKTRWHHIIRLMQIPLAFVILGCIMILLQVSHHGEKMLLAIPVGSWYFGVTAESVHQFGQVFLQCLAAVSCLYFLSTSTPMTELFTALRRMHIPGFLVEMMELVYRYIFVLLEAASQIRNAQESAAGSLRRPLLLSPADSRHTSPPLPHPPVWRSGSRTGCVFWSLLNLTYLSISPFGFLRQGSHLIDDPSH